HVARFLFGSVPSRRSTVPSLPVCPLAVLSRCELTCSGVAPLAPACQQRVASLLALFFPSRIRAAQGRGPPSSSSSSLLLLSLPSLSRTKKEDAPGFRRGGRSDSCQH